MAEPTQRRPAACRPDGPEEHGPIGYRPMGHGPDGPSPDGPQPEGHKPQGRGPGGGRTEGRAPEGPRPEGRGPEGRSLEGPEPDGREPAGREPDGRRAETRQRILTAAGDLFREHGVDGVGVDAVMKQAGLTHGGFYLHFRSKEALAAEVSQSLLQQAASRWDQISNSPDRDVALERIVRHYLDPGRVASAHCCALTTLGPDVARRSASREAIGGALRGMLDALTRVLPGRKRQKALASLATMVGAVVLSRLADDPALAEAFLDAAADSILPATRSSSRSKLSAGPEAT
jgi:TetR/AcrR family transcriptional regulator, transcriptional repressor for nem operon